MRDGEEALEFLFHEGAYAVRTGSEHPKVIGLYWLLLNNLPTP